MFETSATKWHEIINNLYWRKAVSILGTRFEHQHDILYLDSFIDLTCNDNYIDESSRKVCVATVVQATNHIYLHMVMAKNLEI